MAKKLWGDFQPTEKISLVKYGIGEIYWGGNLTNPAFGELYPSFENTVEILTQLSLQPDFNSANNTIRFGHRKTDDKDIFFVANRTESFQSTNCTFRAEGQPELWMATTGETRKIKNYTVENGVTTIPLEFFPYESYFIVFNRNRKSARSEKSKSNFPEFYKIQTLDGSWNVSFDPKWGGPGNIVFNKLQDWSKHEMRGIKFYSGIATYTKKFEVAEPENKKYFVDLGDVHDMARVKLNGKEIGVIWCAPWRIEISEALQKGNNDLEIEVANRWINRLLGDRQETDANVRTVKFENGLMGGKEFSAGRYTFTTEAALWSFKFTEPLLSGLLGPVTIETSGN